MISSSTGVSDLKISVSDLVGLQGKIIKASNIECSAVGYINPTADHDFNYAAWNKIPAPDLVEKIRKPISLNSFESKQIWVTVHSQGSEAGDYTGKISISDANGNVLRNIPIHVTVWPITLPVRPALDVYLFTGVPFGGKSGELWADFLVDHYVSYVYMDLPTDISVGNKPVLHQGREVKDLNLGFDIAGQSINIPGKQWDNLERLKILHSRNLKLNFDSGEGLLPTAILPSFIEYLKKAGYNYGDYRYKISDEDLSPWSLPIFQAYHQVDPKLRLAMIPAGDWDITPYAPYVDTYICSYSVTAWKRWIKYFQEENKDKGKPFSIYTNWPSWVGRAPLDQIRSDLRFIWDIKAPEYAAWTANIYPPTGYTYPYSGAPMRDVRGLTPDQQSTSTLVYFRNEDGVIYPVSCKRLEAIRDGVKDWMYLDLLNNTLKKSQNIVPATLQVNAYSFLQKAAMEKPHSESEFNSAKEKLAQQIMELQKAIKK